MKYGDKFVKGDDRYVLTLLGGSYAGYQMVLVHVAHGRVWDNAVVVNNPNKLTEAEIDAVFGGKRNLFEDWTPTGSK